MQDRRNLQPIARRITKEIVEVWKEYLREAHIAAAERLHESLPVLAHAGSCVDDQTVIGHLKSLLDDDSDRVRRAAAKALGKISTEEATGDLTGQLDDADRVYLATEILCQIAIPEATGDLTDLLDDDHPAGGRDAVKFLGQIRTPEATDALIDRLDHDDPVARQTAALILGKIGTEEATGALTNLLDDQTEHVRWAAAWALGQVGTPEAVAALTDFLDDDANWVRRVAAEALFSLPWYVLLENRSEKLKEALPDPQKPDKNGRKVFRTEDGEHLIVHWQELARLLDAG